MKEKLYYEDVEMIGSYVLGVNNFSYESAATVKPHFHELYEILLYEDVDGECSIDGVKHVIEPGTFIIVPPYSIHSFTIYPGKYTSYVGKFEKELFADGDDIKENLPTYVKHYKLDDSELKFMCDNLNWISTKSDDVSLAFKQDIIRACIRFGLEKGKEQLENDSLDRFSPLLKHLTDNELYTISVENAAKLCRFSKSHFMLTFKKTFGTSFNNFLTDRKVNAAKCALANSSRKVGDIAADLDFTDAAYFIKVFREKTGVSPNKFRKMVSK